MSESSSQADPIRVAFLGGAMNSAVGQAHFAALQLDGRFNVTSGCFSRNSEDNINTAKTYHVSKSNCCSSIHELIKLHKVQFDAIVVLTPTSQHFEHVATCLENDVPVICEKSLATSQDEVTRLNSILRKNKGYLAVTYNYTGYPMIRELQSILQRGELGSIQQIMLEMPQEGFTRLNNLDEPISPQAWRLKDGSIPTVSLDLGAHLQMFIEFLAGEDPHSVVACSDSFGNFNHITDTVSCMARYPSGMICNLWYTKAALGYRNGMKIRVFGSQGSAEWLQVEPEILHLRNKYGDQFKLDRGSSKVTVSNQPRYTRFKAGHPAGYIEAFANYYSDVADDLTRHLTNKPLSSPFVFGVESELKSMALMSAIQESSNTKRWVTVSE